jgi:hypothetical protein
VAESENDAGNVVLDDGLSVPVAVSLTLDRYKNVAEVESLPVAVSLTAGVKIADAPVLSVPVAESEKLVA